MFIIQKIVLRRRLLAVMIHDEELAEEDRRDPFLENLRKKKEQFRKRSSRITLSPFLRRSRTNSPGQLSDKSRYKLTRSRSSTLTPVAKKYSSVLPKISSLMVRPRWKSDSLLYIPQSSKLKQLSVTRTRSEPQLEYGRKPKTKLKTETSQDSAASSAFFPSSIDAITSNVPASLLLKSRNQLVLSPRERTALKSTWSRLRRTSKTSGQGVINLMERVFHFMIKRQPALKNVFYRAAFVCAMDRRGNDRERTITTIRDHALLLVDLIDKIIERLDRDNSIGNPAQLVGEKHSQLRTCGLNSGHWENFGECFVDIMFMQDQVRAYPSASKSWRSFSAVLTDNLRWGFEDMQYRRLNEPSSTRRPLIIPKQRSLDELGSSSNALSCTRPASE